MGVKRGWESENLCHCPSWPPADTDKRKRTAIPIWLLQRKGQQREQGLIRHLLGTFSIREGNGWLATCCVEFNTLAACETFLLDSQEKRIRKRIERESNAVQAIMINAYKWMIRDDEKREKTSTTIIGLNVETSHVANTNRLPVFFCWRV